MALRSWWWAKSCSRCCSRLAKCCSPKAYEAFLAFTMALFMILGIFWIINGIRGRDFYSTMFAWFSIFSQMFGVYCVAARSLISSSIGMGGIAFILGLYGLLAPCFIKEKDTSAKKGATATAAEDEEDPQEQRNKQLRIMLFFLVLFVGATSAIAVVMHMRASRPEVLTMALESGWHDAYRNYGEEHYIEVAQARFECCGFFDKDEESGGRDRAVTPCPPKAERGCETPLREEHGELLVFLAIPLFVGGGVGVMALIWIACLLGQGSKKQKA